MASFDTTPVLWAAAGDHAPPPLLCNEPLTAAALPARRQKADDAAAEAGMKAARITEIDVWPVLIANGFRNTEDGVTADKQLIDHATSYCTTAMHPFLFQNRARRDRRGLPIFSCPMAHNAHTGKHALQRSG